MQFQFDEEAYDKPVAFMPALLPRAPYELVDQVRERLNLTQDVKAMLTEEGIQGPDEDKADV